MRKMVVVGPEKIEWEAVKELPEGAWIKMLSIERRNRSIFCTIQI